MPQYNDWLNSLEAAGLRDDLPPLMKGTAYSVEWQVANTHPILGTISDGTFDMEVKAAPGTAGSVLATATVVSGTVSGGVNPVSISISLAAQSGITEPNAPGVADLFFTILFAPPGGSPTAVRGGLLPVQAGVTS